MYIKKTDYKKIQKDISDFKEKVDNLPEKGSTNKKIKQLQSKLDNLFTETTPKKNNYKVNIKKQKKVEKELAVAKRSLEKLNRKPMRSDKIMSQETRTALLENLNTLSSDFQNVKKSSGEAKTEFLKKNPKELKNEKARLEETIKDQTKLARNFRWAGLSFLGATAVAATLFFIALTPILPVNPIIFFLIGAGCLLIASTLLKTSDGAEWASDKNQLELNRLNSIKVPEEDKKEKKQV